MCAVDGHSDFLPACKTRSEGKLSLEHSNTDVCNASIYDAEGPYDVVILDMALSQLVLALMQVRSSSLSLGPTCNPPTPCLDAAPATLIDPTCSGHGPHL